MSDTSETTEMSVDLIACESRVLAGAFALASEHERRAKAELEAALADTVQSLTSRGQKVPATGAQAYARKDEAGKIVALRWLEPKPAVKADEILAAPVESPA